MIHTEDLYEQFDDILMAVHGSQMERCVALKITTKKINTQITPGIHRIQTENECRVIE